MTTLTANNKYSIRNSENLPQTMQMQLSQKLNFFSDFLAQLLKPISNFKHFQKKVTLIAYAFPKLETAKDVVN